MPQRRKMFYSCDLLSLKSKTLFSTIYYVSSTRKRLTKKEMDNIDLSLTIENIKKPPVPFSLRLYSFFLRGIVRLYILKIKYTENEFKSFLSMLNQNKRKMNINLSIHNTEELHLNRMFKKISKEFGKLDNNIFNFINVDNNNNFDDPENRIAKSNDNLNNNNFIDDNVIDENFIDLPFINDDYNSVNSSLMDNNKYINNGLMDKNNLNSSELAFRGSSSELNNSLSILRSINSSTISDINKPIHSRIIKIENKYDSEIELYENDGYLSKNDRLNVQNNTLKSNKNKRDSIFSEIECLIKRIKIETKSISPLDDSNYLNDDFSGDSYKIEYNDHCDKEYNDCNQDNNSKISDEISDGDNLSNIVFHNFQSFLSLVSKKSRKIKALCFHKLLYLCSIGDIIASQYGNDIKYYMVTND
ncbi:hypothetical protein DMUE_3095 [Dictyocoela muelleri]|nr:hypothetical protein DMUE_3095 [Dictyocoela muelleri]